MEGNIIIDDRGYSYVGIDIWNAKGNIKIDGKIYQLFRSRFHLYKIERRNFQIENNKVTFNVDSDEMAITIWSFIHVMLFQNPIIDYIGKSAFLLWLALLLGNFILSSLMFKLLKKSEVLKSALMFSLLWSLFLYYIGVIITGLAGVPGVGFGNANEFISANAITFIIILLLKKEKLKLRDK